MAVWFIANMHIFMNYEQHVSQHNCLLFPAALSIILLYLMQSRGFLLQMRFVAVRVNCHKMESCNEFKLSSQGGMQSRREHRYHFSTS